MYLHAELYGSQVFKPSRHYFLLLTCIITKDTAEVNPYGK